MSIAKRKFKYTDHVLTSINAAKMSIEMFNRIDFYHKDESSLIFAGQAWELLAKGLLIKELGTDEIKLSNGKSITAEKAINKITHELFKINQNEAEIIMQIISLRNVAMHDVMPKIPQEIITHLLYYSVKSFRKVVKKNFPTYFKKGFNQNFLSISFDNYTFYSDKVSRLFNKSKKYSSEQHKLLYLLDRGVDFARKPKAANMQSLVIWQEKIKKLPRKSRVAMHLSIYKHISENDDIRFVPIETPRGYKAKVEISRTKNKKDATTILIHKTDPNKDYPHTTTEMGLKIGKSTNFIAKMAKVLSVREDQEYCYLVRVGKSGKVPKYSDAALTYMKQYLDEHVNFNPYHITYR